MKKKDLSKALLFIVILGSGILNACSNKDLYDENKTNTTKDASSIFDFSMNQTISLNLDYGFTGLKAGFKIYAKNPMLSDGTLNQEIAPIFTGYTDSNCKFSKSLVIPSSVSEIYVYSSNSTIPHLLPLTIINGKAEYVTAGNATSRNISYSGNSINIGTNYSTISGANNLYAIYTDYSKGGNIWYPYNPIQNLYSSLSYSTQLTPNSSLGELIDRLDYGLDASKIYGNDNSQYIRDTEHVNTTIANKSQNGETVDGAHLDLVFLAATGSYQNAMAYYYYPSSKKDIDAEYIKSLPKYFVYPRTTGNLIIKYTNGSYPTSIIKARLQFFGSDYKSAGTDVFPAGYTIGWMLVADIKGSLNYQAPINKVNANISTAYTNGQAIYSNKEANYNQNPGCISLYDKKSEKVVIGFEDQAFLNKNDDGTIGDNSYNDMLFYVDADPVSAIYDPDQPNVPDSPETLPDQTYKTAEGTLAFEDIWPNGGDYDMNDVAIEYATEVTVNGTNIKQIVDTYKIVNKQGAAIKKDAFGFVINDNFGGTITSSSSEFTKEADGQYILFNDAQEHIGETFTVTRTFNESNYPQNAIYVRNYNPFIVPDYAKGVKNRIEIHLPKAVATTWASSNDGGENAYYVNKDGKYPFAIDLSGVTTFDMISEGQKIGSTGEYPFFLNWVESAGKNYTDWYLYKNGK